MEVENCENYEKHEKQAVAELCQAHVKFKLDLDSVR